MRTLSPKYATLIALMALIAVAPLFFPSTFYYRIGALIFINGLAVIGLVVLIGYAGQISLGHAGFAAAVLGGMGNPFGALVGGLLVGLIEAMTAGYISSDYKDAAAFIVILAVLFVMPHGIFGRATVERV